MSQPKWLDWAVELQALAQAGLTYGKDKYDLERYRRIRELAAEMMSQGSGLPMEQVEGLFCNETGYQTPKIDTRAAIFQGDKILLVHEAEGAWALPGGWCEVDLSPVENTIKEAREEAGLEIVVDRLITVQMQRKHNQPPLAYGVCKFFFQCTAAGGQFVPNLETTESRYFGLDELPELAQEKNSTEQVQLCFAARRAPDWKPLVD